MALAHFRMLINELLKKDPDIVPEEAPLIILDRKSSVCMDNNGKDNNHTRNISKIINFVGNGEKWKMRKIDWCEVGMKLADNVTKNVGDNDLNPWIKYIMVRIDNW